jgi:co-chaperonin GroES (HSP10)
MKPIRDFLVEIPKRFKDEIELSDGDMGVEEGDELYFHHHVVTTLDKYSQEIEKKKFNVRPDQAIAHKNKDGMIKSLGEWVLVEPVEQNEKLSSDIIEVIQEKTNSMGRVKYMSKDYHDVKEGDLVEFSKNSDYEIEIDGEPMWRMLYTDMLFVWLEEDDQ